VRAWQRGDGFEGRAALKIVAVSHRHQTCAWTCCADGSGAPSRWISAARPRPMSSPAPRGRRNVWVTPIPRRPGVVPDDGDPAELATQRESHPAGLRCRVAGSAGQAARPSSSCARCCAGRPVRWAQLLETSVASVNSALQRARATLAARDAATHREPIDAEQKALLAKYVDAFRAL